MEQYLEANLELWKTWTRIHATSAFYNLESFKTGPTKDRPHDAAPGVRVRGFEVDELGDVRGKSLLHLQCHFGIDTLSWARLGARVTGADLSPTAVALARRVADEIGFPEARFVQSNVYALPAVLDGEFDVVYTSRGVLGWLPEVAGWATVVARYVRPGGRFYLNEIHPIAQA